MSRPKKKESEKKIRINITLDKSVYRNLKDRGIPISTYVGNLINLARAHNPEVGGSNPPPASFSFTTLSAPCSQSYLAHPDGVFSFSDFFTWLNDKNLSPKYRDAIISKIHTLMSKSVYKNSLDVTTEIQQKLGIISKDRYLIYATRLILKYLENNNQVSMEDLNILKKRIGNIRSHADNYVPTVDEINNTIKKLPTTYKTLYLMYLYSGMRKVEGEYIIKNINKLQAQQHEGFIKIRLDLYRNTKNAFNCYLPDKIYKQLIKGQYSIRGLEMYIKRHKLIPVKYCRKYFYTKCIELGIPDSIADYYQGRVSGSIGNNHYLAKQALADKYYTKILSIQSII